MQNSSEIFSQHEYRHSAMKEESKWNINDGYKNEKEFETYPHRALPNGEYGFNIVLNLKSTDLDFMCKGPVQGFKVRVHSPNEFPEMSNGAFRVPLNEEVVVALSAEMTKDETKFDGTCHTSKTKSLKFFNEYSQLNCLSECKSNYVLGKCGCVKFSMIRDNKTKVCTQHDMTCIVDAIDKFSTNKRFKSEFPCDCRPSCNNLNYKIDISTAVFDFNQVFKAYKEPLENEFPKSIMSRMVVYFKEDHYTLKAIYDNEESWSTVLAQIGGIVALFIGASIISIIELFYFFAKKFFV